jgi:hypothetical protein
MSNPFLRKTPGYGRITDVAASSFGQYDNTSWKITDKGYTVTITLHGGNLGAMELLFVDEVNIPNRVIFDADPTGSTPVPPYIPVIRQTTGNLYFMPENPAIGTPRLLGSDRYTYTTPPTLERYPIAVIVSRDMRYPPQLRMAGNSDPNGMGKIIVVDNFGKEYVIPYTMSSMGYGPHIPPFVYLPYNSKRDAVPLSDGMIDFIKSGSALYGAIGTDVVLGKLPSANPSQRFYTAIQSALDDCGSVPTAATVSSSNAAGTGSSSNSAADEDPGKPNMNRLAQEQNEVIQARLALEQAASVKKGGRRRVHFTKRVRRHTIKH